MVLSCEGELYDFLTKVKEALATVFIVSQVEIKKGTDGQYKGNVEGLSVSIEKADGQLCPRCWMYSDTVGSDPKHPDLCARCAQIIG